MKKLLTFMLMFMTLTLISCDTVTTKDNTTNSSSETTMDLSSSTTETTVEATTENNDLSYVIDNQVLIDNEHCRVTAVETYDDYIWGFSLKLLVENNTTDKTLMFSVGSATINGYVIDPFWAKEVTAGNKANTVLTFSNSDIEEAGITSVDEIKLYFRVYDSDDWMADDFYDDILTIYPTGKSSSEISSPNRPTNENEFVVVDDENCTFVILDSYTDDIWGYTILYYIENLTTDLELMYSWDDVSVNGFMIDPFWATSIYASNKKIGTITFSESSFEENDISEVNMIEFNLTIYDSNDWMADDLIDSVYQYNPTN